jgi:hypothetical protein
MYFQNRSASGENNISNLFADFFQDTYTDDPLIPSNPGPNDVSTEPSFGTMQFSIEEVIKVFLKLDSSKGPGPDGVPPNILKNCASAYATPLTCIFNKSLASCLSPKNGNSRS